MAHADLALAGGGIHPLLSLLYEIDEPLLARIEGELEERRQQAVAGAAQASYGAAQ